MPLLVDSGDRTDRQWSVGARAVTAPRTHTLFAGVDVGRASARIGPSFSGAVSELIDGNRARIWQYSNTGVDAHRHATTVTAFLVDRIALGPGRTLDAGVGYDGVTGSADQAATGISWQNVLPRALLRWKRSESSFVTYVAGYRRAVDRLTLDTLAVGDPFAPTAVVSRWTRSGRGTSRRARRSRHGRRPDVQRHRSVTQPADDRRSDCRRRCPADSGHPRTHYRRRQAHRGTCSTLSIRARRFPATRRSRSSTDVLNPTAATCCCPSTTGCRRASAPIAIC